MSIKVTYELSCGLVVHDSRECLLVIGGKSLSVNDEERLLAILEDRMDKRCRPLTERVLICKSCGTTSRTHLLERKLALKRKLAESVKNSLRIRIANTR